MNFSWHNIHTSRADISVQGAYLRPVMMDCVVVGLGMDKLNEAFAPITVHTSAHHSGGSSG